MKHRATDRIFICFTGSVQILEKAEMFPWVKKSKSIVPYEHRNVLHKIVVPNHGPNIWAKFSEDEGKEVELDEKT